MPEAIFPSDSALLLSAPIRMGALLKAARCQQGLTQAEVAGFAGIDKSYLSKLESGKSAYPPSDRVLSALASKLCLDAGTLTSLAGRVSPEDLAIASELYRRWGQDFLLLLRGMVASPSFAKAVLAKSESESPA